MKWSLQQLFKYGDKSFDFEFTIDLRERIENIDDIIDISLVHVHGEGIHIWEDRYQFNLYINTNLILEDAVTLDLLEFPIEINTVETYDVKEGYNEDVRIIEMNTIDLTDAIWENILVLKPMRITKTDTE